MKSIKTTILLFLIFFIQFLSAQSPKKKNKTATGSPTSTVVIPPPSIAPDLSALEGLKWRNIGPFRGGRANAICGVPDQDMVFYAGYTGGGVWKTEDGGNNWKNISDGFFTTNTIGDIAVAKTDANVIYVGTGEHAPRGVMTTFGNGVYKSTDAGQSWKHIGLEQTRHISDVIIHPQNHDIVYVGAQGPLHGPGIDRGVFKSVDGGLTWKKTLFINENTGVSSLIMDPNNARNMYAATWQHRRYPWKIESGGPGSNIYKSTDGGETWTKLMKGLPDMMGKIGLSISAANSQRIYALIEAEKTISGLYRSDDAGQTWALMSNNQLITARAWYYMEVFADPTNENTVYALNAPLMKSIDGGKTFENMRVIHGDCHDLWLHPTKNNIMAMAEDGGATITFNKGKYWSTFNNQPTGQFYRITADKQVPFWVYGGQQDNFSATIPTRTPDYGILSRNWMNSAGCESAMIALDDPYQPRITYGGCYNGRLSLLDNVTKQEKDIQPYPVTNLAYQPKDMKYRFNWNSPLINSPHDYKTMYYGGNMVFKTTNGGLDWTIISGDLTRNEVSKQGLGGGPFTNEGAGGENYNTVYYIIESPHEKGLIYTGSDCGLVHITRNGGTEWKNITPPGLEECSIHAIEVSPHEKGTVYIAANRYKFNDFRNFAFKSTDYGATWKKIGDAINKDDFFNVIREDKKQKGLLYAGAERGFYISFDGGDHFYNLQLNFPKVRITDLTIQDNSLAASTAGRAFWILDDLSTLQQSKGKFDAQFTLYEPKTQYRFPAVPPFFLITEHAFGQNPVDGAAIQYYISDTSGNKDLKLEIYTESGELIRTYTGKKGLVTSAADGDRGNLPVANVDTPSIQKGLNTFVWDLRTQGLDKMKEFIQESDYRGYRVSPGTYKAKMMYGKETKEVPIILMDPPSVKIAPSMWTLQQSMQKNLTNRIREIQTSMKTSMTINQQLDQINERLKAEPDEELIKKRDQLSEKLKTWQTQIVELRQKGFQDALNWPAGIISEFFFVRSNLDTYEPAIPKGYIQRVQDLESKWIEKQKTFDQIINNEVREFNELVKQKNLPLLPVPKNIIIKP